MPDITTEMIDYPSNGHITPAYLAQPTDPTAHAVIAIQEWWGLVPHIKDIADRFAAEGFLTLAPDLYHGQHADEPDEARKLAMALDRDRAIAEICAAADYALTQPGITAVGVVGWCMGGGLALATAATCPDHIRATVVFYGRPLADSDVPTLKAPVLGHYAEHDGGIPLDAVHAFQSALATHNVPHDIHIYPGAQHGFFNDTRPQIYAPAAATTAWNRTLAWFRTHL